MKNTTFFNIDWGGGGDTSSSFSVPTTFVRDFKYFKIVVNSNEEMKQKIILTRKGKVFCWISVPFFEGGFPAFDKI